MGSVGLVGAVSTNLEARRQRVVAHGELQRGAGLQQQLHGVAVRGARQLCAVHLDEPVAHAELARARRHSARHDLVILPYSI